MKPWNLINNSKLSLKLWQNPWKFLKMTRKRVFTFKETWNWRKVAEKEKRAEGCDELIYQQVLAFWFKLNVIPDWTSASEDKSIRKQHPDPAGPTSTPSDCERVLDSPSRTRRIPGLRVTWRFDTNWAHVGWTGGILHPQQTHRLMPSRTARKLPLQRPESDSSYRLGVKLYLCINIII